MSCEGCVYAACLGGDWYCDYLLTVGRRRPCPPGDACTVRAEAERDPKKKWKEGYSMKARSWDTERARALYDQGRADAEIAAEVGATASAVAFWRRKLGLPANHARQAPAKATVEERPLRLPSARGPVELSVELDGRAFALRAPDLEGAAWIHEYAGKLLEDMGQIAAKMKEEMDDA